MHYTKTRVWSIGLNSLILNLTSLLWGALTLWTRLFAPPGCKTQRLKNATSDVTVVWVFISPACFIIVEKEVEGTDDGFKINVNLCMNQIYDKKGKIQVKKTNKTKNR